MIDKRRQPSTITQTINTLLVRVVISQNNKKNRIYVHLLQYFLHVIHYIFGKVHVVASFFSLQISFFFLLFQSISLFHSLEEKKIVSSGKRFNRARFADQIFSCDIIKLVENTDTIYKTQ